MGISGNKAAGLTTPGLPYIVDLAQVNGISLTSTAVSAVVNVGTTGERYAGVFARRDAAGDMYVAMLGVNTTGTPHNPASTPTAALLFRFTPGLAGTQSGGWTFLVYTLLPTPPNTGSANLGLDVTGTGENTVLNLYLNGVSTLTFIEAEEAAIGVSHHGLNGPGGVGLFSVDAGTTYGTFIAGLPGSVPQAQELAGSPGSGLGVSSLTAAGLASIVTEAEARWKTAGLTAAQLAQLQGLQFVIATLSPGLLGDYVPGVISLDATADGWGWFVDPTPGQDEEFTSAGRSPLLQPSSGNASPVSNLENRVVSASTTNCRCATRKSPDADRPAAAGPFLSQLNSHRSNCAPCGPPFLSFEGGTCSFRAEDCSGYPFCSYLVPPAPPSLPWSGRRRPSMTVYKHPTLPNGLRVYLKPVPGCGTVTTLVAYKVGSADEDLDHTGLSHYLEHLMFKGTEKLMPGDIDPAHAAQRRRQQRLHHRRLHDLSLRLRRRPLAGPALEIEADRMRNLRIDAKHEFEQEKGAVISELERNEDEPWDLE